MSNYPLATSTWDEEELKAITHIDKTSRLQTVTEKQHKRFYDILKELESEGLEVIYGDTDSVFFRSPHSNLEETISFGEPSASFSPKFKTITLSAISITIFMS